MKAKGEGAKARWLSDASKRYFTIDFGSRQFYYSHKEDSRKVDGRIPFEDILSVDLLPSGARSAKSPGQGAAGFAVETRQRTYVLYADSALDAMQWVDGLHGAQEILRGDGGGSAPPTHLDTKVVCCPWATPIALALLIAATVGAFLLAGRQATTCLHGPAKALAATAAHPLRALWQPPAPAMDLRNWTRHCTQLPRAPDASRWPGQNMCWRWMKRIGCYEAGWGTISWREGQERAARQGYAPHPGALAMEPVRHPEVCEKRSNGAAVHADASEVRAAQAWLNQAVSVHVLNLPTDTDRWARISARLTHLGVRFRRIAGVDLRVRGGFAAAKAEGWIPQGFNFSLAQANANSSFNSMGGILGTVGCATAHLRAQSIASQDQKPFALVLEDDVVLADDFAVKLKRLLEDEAPCDWSAISLKSHCPYGECVSPRLTRVQPDGNEPAERCRHGVNYGFFAMLYRVSDLGSLSSQLATRVFDESAPHCLDVDVALASISDQVAYYAVPGVQAPGFLSEGSFASAREDSNGVAAPAVEQAVAAATSEDDKAGRSPFSIST